MTHSARAPDAPPTRDAARADTAQRPAAQATPAPARLTRRADFLKAAKAARAGGAVMTVQAVDRGDAGTARLGLTVSKKNGTATERNRIRRRLREAARQVGAPGFRPGLDYVVIARRGVIDRPFAALIGDLAGAIRRLGQARPAPAAAAAPDTRPAPAAVSVTDPRPAPAAAAAPDTRPTRAGAAGPAVDPLPDPSPQAAGPRPRRDRPR